MIAIIDYDAGNIKSVEHAFRFLGAETIVTGDPKQIAAADKVVLPGVGAFGDAMMKIRRYGLEEVIMRTVKSRTPLLGICLGLQLLFEESEESPGIKGLGLLPGKIKRIPSAHDLKIPHMGWNSIQFPRPGRLFKGMGEDVYVYFVHSYYLCGEYDWSDWLDRSDGYNRQGRDEAAVCPDREAIVTAVTEYGIRIPVSVEKDNLYACQFHPEKSSEAGLVILENFIRI